MLRPKNWKSEKKKIKRCHEIEPKDRAMHEGDSLSILDEFMKVSFDR
jgi:hypothetical protein